MNQLKQFLAQYGFVGLIRFASYPFTALVFNPIRTVQSLSGTVPYLLNGNWRFVRHFDLRASLNSFFYATRAFNLYTYGRTGKSPTLGLGDYPLSRCFNYSLLSLYFYWGAGLIMLLISMFGFLGMHFLYLDGSNLVWVSIVIGLSLCSTIFYANLFRFQNYNALGWLFFPIGVWGLLQGNYWMAGLGWLLCSFGSFTTIFIAGILTFVWTCLNYSIFPLLSIIPAVLKLSLHFYPFLVGGNMKEVLSKVAKAIGFSDQKAKYKRKVTKRFDLRKLYFLLLFIQFIVVHYVLIQELPFLFIIGMGIFLLNSLFFRFADEQSIFMMILSIAMATIITHENYILLASFWLAVSPLPVLFGYDHRKGVMDIVPVSYPVNIESLYYGMEVFISNIPAKSKVLMGFDDPGIAYEKVFNGYRYLLEMPCYIASQRQIHFLPEWWSVFELNYEGAPDIWGRDIMKMNQNASYWHANYVIAYTINEDVDTQTWKENGFELIDSFIWNNYEELFRGYPKMKIGGLKWWLFRKY